MTQYVDKIHPTDNRQFHPNLLNSVESHLEESLAVDPSRDFPDEDGREALRPQPLVHAQKVDLHHLHRPGIVSAVDVK